MTSNLPQDEDLPDSAPVSADAITPRGGFMARPGLKSPPRHAVVVRGGDAPESEHIPVLRPSVPPPPPVSEPAPLLTSEKITVRAIPTPTPPAAEVAGQNPAPAVRAIESLPPPSDIPSSRSPLSDAPFVTHLEPTLGGAARRPTGSRWAIAAAAAAGLLLGLVSVAVKLSGPGAAAQQPPADSLPSLATPPTPAQPAPALVDSAESPHDPAATAPSGQRREPKPARPAPQTAKRSIF